MDAETALRALKLPWNQEYNRDAVKSAFAERAKALHPDTLGSEVDNAFCAAALSEAKRARDTLLAALLEHVEDEADEECPLCKGRGFVRRGFRHSQCSNCGGTGVKVTSTRRPR